MKFQNITKTRQVPRTIDGTTNLITERFTVQVPKPPADWDARGLKAAVASSLTMTGVSMVWSTISIGALLHGGVGYMAAAVFDASWLVVLLLEWLARFDPSKRGFAKFTGWVLLAGTMGAILWHGLLAGSTALAVVGAAISLVAKSLWWGVMRFIDVDLSDEDAQWVIAEKSKANAKRAIAGVRRQAARAESSAVAELLAAEAIRTEYAAAAVAMAGAGDARPVSAAPVPDLSELLSVVRPTSAPEQAEPQVSVYADSEDVRPVPAPASTVPTFLAPELPEPVRPVPAPVPADSERVPLQAVRSASVAGAVRELQAQGVTDMDLLVKTVPAMVGRPVDPATVKREARRQRAGVTTSVTTSEPSIGTGLYM
jgi:hypothetical protein